MKILLLDAYNLIHRAKSGYTKGDYHIVYNFFRGLRPLVEKFSPDKVYFVLEGHPKHRGTIHSDYKSNRPSQSDSFKRQKSIILSLMKDNFPVECVYHPDFECDDVIATLTYYHTRKGDDCTVISTDTDMIQIHNVCNFTLYNPVKKKNIDGPEYDYVAWKALRGDKADNIPGIPGIGDKRAENLIRNKDMLLEFLNNEENRLTFEKNVNLIRLVDLSDSLLEFIRYPEMRKWEETRESFEEMGFKSMIKESTWNNYMKTFSTIKF